MVFSLVGSSVSAAALTTTYNVNTSHKKNETAAQAINIGNLDEESTKVSVSNAGSAGTNAVSQSFTAQQGTTSLAQSFSNPVELASSRFQLADSKGNILADSQGSTAQQAAYQEWLNGTLTIEAGTYTATATPFAGLGAQLTISRQEQQGTSLQVSSSLTGSDPTEYYNFNFSGANLKLNFNAQSGSNSPHVQLLGSNGHIVADNQGNSFQKSNYQALTSGTGLTTASGQYTVKVSYPSNLSSTPTVPYDFQLYSGNSYAIVYKTKAVAQPTDNTAAGSVTADPKALLYKATRYNQINATATKNNVDIGWIQKDKSALDVFSQLTSADSTDFYSLTLQQGDNLKFGFNTKTTKNPSALRVQLYNSTGTYLYADSQGTKAQQAAYQSLTTTNGLTTKPGNFVVKISYAGKAPVTATPYEFGIYSGTTYSAVYKTTASAQTIGNAIAAGTYAGNASANAALASYLTASSQNDTTTLNNSLSAALSAFI